MVKKIYKYISEYKMLDDIHNLVVGLSGGADSVCLISVLSVIARDYIEEIGHEIPPRRRSVPPALQGRIPQILGRRIYRRTLQRRRHQDLRQVLRRRIRDNQGIQTA